VQADSTTSKAVYPAYTPQLLGMRQRQEEEGLFPRRRQRGVMHFAAASPGGVLGLFAETSVSPSPVNWGPLGRNVAFLDAPRSVTELADGQVLDVVRRLAGR
jgi:hypothetical protein